MVFQSILSDWSKVSQGTCIFAVLCGRLKIKNLAENGQILAKNLTFFNMGPTNEFETKFSGSSIQFEYSNCKQLKRFLQFNWDIDAFYCGRLNRPGRENLTHLRGLPPWPSWISLSMCRPQGITSWHTYYPHGITQLPAVIFENGRYRFLMTVSTWRDTVLQGPKFSISISQWSHFALII